MKVLHVLSSSRFSGAENVVCQIIRMFDNEIEMAYTSKDGEIAKTLEKLGVPFFPMKELCHRELKRVIAQYQPDILHGHDIRGAFEVSRFAKNHKIIHTIHVNDTRMQRLTAKSLLYKIASKKASHIFWVSESCYKQYRYREMIEQKSSVLMNVIDSLAAREKSKEDAKPYDVLFIGRFTAQKNPERFVRIVEMLGKQRPSTTVAMIGVGEKEDSVREYIREKKLDKQISLLGFQQNSLKYLARTNVLLLSSDWEGTPMVALEAMALGIPVVSTPTDGMCDVIENGSNGFLEQEEEALAKRVWQLLEDAALHKKLQEGQLLKNEKINNVASYKKALEEVYQ